MEPLTPFILGSAEKRCQRRRNLTTKRDVYQKTGMLTSTKAQMVIGLARYDCRGAFGTIIKEAEDRSGALPL